MRLWSIGRVMSGWLASVVIGGACGGDGDGGGATSCERSAAALRRCELIDDQPLPCDPEAESPAAACTVGCLEATECGTLSALFCGAANPQTADSADLLSCLEGCWEQYGFQCASGDQSVDPTFPCDGEADCDDGSDELGCAMFDCGDGTSVVQAFECDGFPDCASASDESSCEQFTCGDGSRVPLDFRCDGGVPDCSDGSDESGCPPVATLSCEPPS